MKNRSFLYELSAYLIYVKVGDKCSFSAYESLFHYHIHSDILWIDYQQPSGISSIISLFLKLLSASH